MTPWDLIVWGLSASVAVFFVTFALVAGISAGRQL